MPNLQGPNAANEYRRRTERKALRVEKAGGNHEKSGRKARFSIMPSVRTAYWDMPFSLKKRSAPGCSGTGMPPRASSILIALAALWAAASWSRFS